MKSLILLFGRCPALLLVSVVFLAPSVGFAQAGGPPLGKWVLERTSPTPDGPAPQSAMVRTFQDWGGGVVAVTNDGVGADGSPTGNRIVFRYDGRDYPMAARDQTDYATIAFVVTSVNPWVADYTIKVNGNVVGTATESISRNGRTMTVETRGPDPDGLVMQTGYWEKH